MTSASAPSAEVLAVIALADQRLKPDLAEVRRVSARSAPAEVQDASARVDSPCAGARAAPVLAEAHHASAGEHATPVLVHAEFQDAPMRAEAHASARGTDASPQALLAAHVRTAFARAGRDLEGQQDGEEPARGRGRGYRAAVLALMDCLRPRAGEDKETPSQ